jgi:argininosuccinate synthase
MDAIARADSLMAEVIVIAICTDWPFERDYCIIDYFDTIETENSESEEINFSLEENVLQISDE